MLSLFSHVQLFETPWTVAHQAPASMGFSTQEYWSGLPFPSPGDLPDPGIEPTSLMSPALAGRFFTTSATWEPLSSVRFNTSRLPAMHRAPWGQERVCSRKVTREGPRAASGARLWTVPGAPTLIHSPRGRTGSSVRFSFGKGKSLTPGDCALQQFRWRRDRASSRPACRWCPALVSGFFPLVRGRRACRKAGAGKEGTTAGSVCWAMNCSPPPSV